MDQENREYAGFWIRVGATFIDFFVLLIPIVIYWMFLFYWKNLGLVLVVYILITLYKPFMEYKYGATVGKMVLGLKVFSSELEKLSVKQTLVRANPWLVQSALGIYIYVALMTHPSFESAEGFMEIAQLQEQITPSLLQVVFSLYFAICVITVAFNKNKQGGHDLMANTVCLNEST
ncbi:MAG: RDD family protein [Cytophagales bacterium]